MHLTWLGHATWSIVTGQHTLLIDPFLDGNPAAAAKADDVAADFILLTHGHADHVADAVKIAKRTGATVIANYEIYEWLAKQGVANAVGMNLGGWGTFPF
ncbi:MAG TPA: MBL fold metallo-hydrolase, partial [Pirellulales bacterium]|nr:MBL fold metallo-hydrolase [Pirellulales bacterium]